MITRALLAAAIGIGTLIGFIAVFGGWLKLLFRDQTELELRGIPGATPLPPRPIWSPDERRTKLGERRTSAR